MRPGTRTARQRQEGPRRNFSDRPVLRTKEDRAIPTIDQLPDSRRAILKSLKQRGPATIAQLADALGLTGEAVRQQLLQLHREGWVEARVERGNERARTGRPATIYSLSEAGDHLFPKQYDALSIAVIDAVAEEIGADALKRVLSRLTDERVSSFGPGLRGLTFQEKIEALKSWYLADDPYMEADSRNGSFRLIERNCPFLNTAMHRPALCSISVNALTRILGVRVEREERFQDGDGRCVFRIHADQPVDATKWEFRLESELPRLR